MRREIAVAHSVSSSRMRGPKYSRDADDRTEKPWRTGSPAFAGDDSGWWGAFEIQIEQQIQLRRGNLHFANQRRQRLGVVDRPHDHRLVATADLDLLLRQDVGGDAGGGTDFV